MGGNVRAAIRISSASATPDSIATAASNASRAAANTANALATTSLEVRAASTLSRTSQRNADGDHNGVCRAAAAAAATTRLTHKLCPGHNGICKCAAASSTPAAAFSTDEGASSWHTTGGNARQPQSTTVVTSANAEYASQQAATNCGTHGDDAGDGHAGWL